jgi:transposase
MSSLIVPDTLWEAFQPLLLTEPPKPIGGRPRVSDRADFAGIVFVLRTGCMWRLLPKELRCGSEVVWDLMQTERVPWQQVTAELVVRRYTYLVLAIALLVLLRAQKAIHWPSHRS